MQPTPCIDFILWSNRKAMLWVLLSRMKVTQFYRFIVQAKETKNVLKIREYSVVVYYYFRYKMSTINWKKNKFVLLFLNKNIFLKSVIGNSIFHDK